MELMEKVSDVLARSSDRLEARKALWAELVAAFERNGAPAATQNLADRANSITSKFDKTLQELTKKL